MNPRGPGTDVYVWTANKDGATFRALKMKCRIGFLINASPPWDLQRL